MSKPPKLAIITCCLDDWGGSEELWARSIPILQNEGIGQITIYKNTINLNHPEYVKFKKIGVKFRELEPNGPFFRKVVSKMRDTLYRIYDKLGLVTYNWNKPAERLYNYLKKSPPDLAIISQAINFDGLVFAYQCLKLNIPYIIVTQKAVDFYWPQANDRAYMRETMLKAKKCLFVSIHNKLLTEEQFAVRLNNSQIVFNPVKTSVGPLPFPPTAGGYRLACIGRLFVIDKGQDILLKILSRQKWKERNITISFIGTGPDLDSLSEMADLLGVKNVSFTGFSDNIENTWANHHALILPSRSEGLPLVIVEAMALGRIAITTNAGGNAEIIQDKVTGFIGEANENDFDEAMELAWSKRGEWEAMGLKAAQHIEETVPQSPEKIFAGLVRNTLNNL